MTQEDGAKAGRDARAADDSEDVRRHVVHTSAFGDHCQDTLVDLHRSHSLSLARHSLAVALARAGCLGAHSRTDASRLPQRYCRNVIYDCDMLEWGCCNGI